MPSRKNWTQRRRAGELVIVTTPEGREIKISLEKFGQEIEVSIEIDRSCDVRSMTKSQIEWLSDKSNRALKILDDEEPN